MTTTRRSHAEVHGRGRLMGRAAMGYDVPQLYAELIEPRYAPIADALVAAAKPGCADDVLELGAGTGLATRRLAGSVRTLVATDRSAGMLDVARSSERARGVSFALVDYTMPLPFLDGSFDLVVSGLTYAQDAREPVAEVARILRPGGRFTLAMWGARYHELRLLRDAVTALGRPRLPSPSPATAMRRIERAGFVDVERRDLELATVFDDPASYVAYRRAFGRPPGASAALHRQYLRSIERRAREDVERNGRLRIGWVVTILTARRPATDSRNR